MHLSGIGQSMGNIDKYEGGREVSGKGRSEEREYSSSADLASHTFTVYRWRCKSL